MKKLLILSFILVMFSQFSFAQKGNADSLKIAILNQRVEALHFNLQAAKKSHNTSAIFGVIAVGVASTPLFTDLSKDDITLVAGAAGVAALVSFILEQKAWSRIGDGYDSGVKYERVRYQGVRKGYEEEQEE